MSGAEFARVLLVRVQDAQLAATAAAIVAVVALALAILALVVSMRRQQP